MRMRFLLVKPMVHHRNPSTRAALSRNATTMIPANAMACSAVVSSPQPSSTDSKNGTPGVPLDRMFTRGRIDPRATISSSATRMEPSTTNPRRTRMGLSTRYCVPSGRRFFRNRVSTGPS